MPDLNPDQFFHGTTHNITDGMVRPAADVDKDVSEYSFGDPGDMSEGDHAFAVRNDEKYAWHAARTFHSNGRRPRVYEVHPAADMKPGPWNKEHPDFLEHHELGGTGWEAPYPEEIAEAHKQHQDEWASKTGFPIKNRIDIMPGRQGTFPSKNWNVFHKHGAHVGAVDNVNHPDDNQVKYGSQGLPGNVEAYGPEERPVPRRETGQTLRDFMAGKPAPKPGEPGHPQGALF